MLLLLVVEYTAWMVEFVEAFDYYTFVKVDTSLVVVVVVIPLMTVVVAVVDLDDLDNIVDLEFAFVGTFD